MSDAAVFPAQQPATRLANVRAAMAAREIDGLPIASPEYIYHLTGLDRRGSLQPTS